MNSAFSRWPRALLVAACVALLNCAAWRAFNAPLDAPDVRGSISGLAYNAFQRWDSPLDRRYPSDERIAADLRQLAGITDRLRTYSSSEFPALPGIAERLGLKLAAGVWLDRRHDNNQREYEAIARALHQHRNIERVIVGNETLVHRSLAVPELAAWLQRVRRVARVPVSTAEPWHIWLAHPELARHVDFITVHLLPYWEGVPAHAAVDYAMERLDELRARFPGKPIVIGEIGWPSGGDAVGAARAGAAEQALFVRGFLARAQALDYYVMEAVDQPWKAATEGRSGAYWGLADAARVTKFALQGAVQADPRWHGKAIVSSLAGFALLGAFLLRFARMSLAGRIAFALMAQAVVSFAVALAALPFTHYLRPIDWAALALLGPVLATMGATLLAQTFEFAELYWDGSLERRFAPKPLEAGAREPFVSIHLACRNEQPQVVIAAIDSLVALDYRAFEVIVVSNNTDDEALWRPIEAHLGRLGNPRVRFIHLPVWPGYKAGALNVALGASDARAEIVGVVDADYVVRRDWLAALVGHFDDASVGVVQSPQAHRGWAREPLRRMMNWEYEGFFRIGMHHRNERDAIIQHGTMTLVRASGLREHGRWSEWCLCEDSELGLRLVQRGLRTVYVDRVMGEGLTPDDFAAYKNQRRRWAQGAMQIMKAHARELLVAGRMRLGQRYHYVAGWLPWIGDALHLVFSLAAIAWTIGAIARPGWFSLPIALFVLPLAVFFATRLVLVPLLYSRRVRCSAGETAGATLAGVGLSHAIARGVIDGLLKRRGVFQVTRKGRAVRAAGRLGAVREEAALACALAACIAALWVARPAATPEVLLWLGVLGLQALPYLAAVACEALSRLASTLPLALAEGERPALLLPAPHGRRSASRSSSGRRSS